MGLAVSCEVFQNSDYKIQTMKLPAYGQVAFLTETDNTICIKTLKFNSPANMESYKTYLGLVREVSRTIPSLMSVGQLISKNKTEVVKPLTISIQFQFIANSLRQVISSKVLSLKKINQEHPLEYSGSMFTLSDDQSIDSLESQHRKYYKNMFEQVQIITMIDHVLSCICATIKICSSARLPYYHNISPDSIVVDHDGSYKLVDRTVMNLASNMQKAAKLEYCTGIYLSPEEWGKVFKVRQNPKTIEQSSEAECIFCLGMVAVQMGLLCNPCKWAGWNVCHPFELLYDKHLNIMDCRKLDKLICSFQHKFSHRFMQLIRGMVNPNPTKRFSVKTVIDCIKQLVGKNISRSESTVRSQQSTIEGGLLQSSGAIKLNTSLHRRMRTQMISTIPTEQQQHQPIRLRQPRHKKMSEDISPVTQAPEKQLQIKDLLTMFMGQYKNIREHRQRQSRLL